MQLPAGRSAAVLSDTQVQFHQDQIHFLVVHETQLSIHEFTELKCLKQVPKKKRKKKKKTTTTSFSRVAIWTIFVSKYM